MADIRLLRRCHGWAAVVFAYQICDGMGVYGNNKPVYWVEPIINFVFWAGVALSGTMISTILRLVLPDGGAH